MDVAIRGANFDALQMLCEGDLEAALFELLGEVSEEVQEGLNRAVALQQEVCSLFLSPREYPLLIGIKATGKLDYGSVSHVRTISRKGKARIG